MLIISAAEFEAEPLRAALAQHTDINWLTCGVGVLAASATAAAEHAQAACRGQEVLFIGSCGTFGEFTDVALCQAQTIHWSPTCARDGLSYAVDNTPPLQLNSSTHYHDLPSAEVFCAPNISLTTTLPLNAKKGMLHVENIESYACLPLLAKTAKTIDVLLAITNALGKQAHQHWQENYTKAAVLTAEYVKQQRFS